MRKNIHTAGFTLVELLVVVALVGLVITFIVVNIERDVDQLAQIEARRFKALVEYARDESLLTGRPYAVEIDEAGSSYQFLVPGEPWQVVGRDDVLKPRRLPEGVRLRLDLQQSGTSQRLVVVDGLGVITPFALFLRGDSREYSITLDAGQNLQVRHRDVRRQGKG